MERYPIEEMSEEQYQAYRESCDSRSSAEFRLRRESCGIALDELADELGVRLDTAKRWENPKYGSPPSIRAWAVVDACYDRLMDSVNAAIDQVEDIADEFGGEPTVHVAYRRGSMPTRDGESVAQANAAARTAVAALRAMGWSVAVEWADEGAASLAVRAPR